MPDSDTVGTKQCDFAARDGYSVQCVTLIAHFQYFGIHAIFARTDEVRTISTVAITIVALVAVLHIGFLVLEMFLWDKPIGLKIFGHNLEQAKSSKVLAANQGLYNGFLAAGLIWGLSLGAAGIGIVTFFLCCVVVAGLFGAVTASRQILYVQAMPAALGLVLLWIQ